jgi:hypothetical protein
MVEIIVEYHTTPTYMTINALVNLKFLLSIVNVLIKVKGTSKKNRKIQQHKIQPLNISSNKCTIS